jgi:serine/threonine-protein kinase
VAESDLDEATEVDGEAAGTGPSLATVPAKPGAAAAPSIPSSEAETQPGSQRNTTLTPDQAMRADELERTRLFTKVCVALATLLAMASPFLSGSVEMRWTLAACSAVGGVAVLLFSRALREQPLEASLPWLIVTSVLMVASGLGVLLLGVFSPAPMVGTAGIYFFSLGSSRRVALATYIAGSLFHLVPALAIAFGLLHDPGLFRPAGLTSRDLLLAEMMVQAVYLLTFLLARGSRRATRAAVDRLHQALAQVQKREALLAEAHLDLDRALRGGLAGRYTDRKLGPYALGDVIGRGAMSEVYRATHESGQAAVKVLQRDLVADPAQVRRFLREAEIVSAFESPHVVRVLSFGNFGHDHRDGDEPPYIAMELLDGHDLAWHLRRERTLGPERLLELIDQVAQALTEAATRGVVHRDLKPQNLFCVTRSDGARAWKVLDFGVSKLANARGTLTQGAIVGTPGYMAPEQAHGGEVTARSDVFALAVIAYRVLTGRPAFAGKEMPRILFEVCYAQPMRPGRLADLPEDVERVLALGLAKKPNERIESARAFADALRAAFAERLEPASRERADRLLVELPWGARPAM